MDQPRIGTEAQRHPNGTNRTVSRGIRQSNRGQGVRHGGKVTFNAFGTISYDARKKSYILQSYAQGNAGDFALTPTADGYVWDIPAGPSAIIRYTATVKDGARCEVGDRMDESETSRRYGLARSGRSSHEIAQLQQHTTSARFVSQTSHFFLWLVGFLSRLEKYLDSGEFPMYTPKSHFGCIP